MERNKISALHKKIERKRKNEALLTFWKKIIQKCQGTNKTEGEDVDIRKCEENKESSKCKRTHENVHAFPNGSVNNALTTLQDDTQRNENVMGGDDLSTPQNRYKRNEDKSLIQSLIKNVVGEACLGGGTLSKKKKRKKHKVDLHCESEMSSQYDNYNLEHDTIPNTSSLHKKKKKRKEKMGNEGRKDNENICSEVDTNVFSLKGSDAKRGNMLQEAAGEFQPVGENGKSSERIKEVGDRKRKKKKLKSGRNDREDTSNFDYDNTAVYEVLPLKGNDNEEDMSQDDDFQSGGKKKKYSESIKEVGDRKCKKKKKQKNRSEDVDIRKREENLESSKRKQTHENVHAFPNGSVNNALTTLQDDTQRNENVMGGDDLSTPQNRYKRNEDKSLIQSLIKNVVGEACLGGGTLSKKKKRKKHKIDLHCESEMSSQCDNGNLEHDTIPNTSSLHKKKKKRKEKMGNEGRKDNENICSEVDTNVFSLKGSDAKRGNMLQEAAGEFQPVGKNGKSNERIKEVGDRKRKKKKLKSCRNDREDTSNFDYDNTAVDEVLSLKGNDNEENMSQDDDFQSGGKKKKYSESRKEDGERKCKKKRKKWKNRRNENIDIDFDDNTAMDNFVKDASSGHSSSVTDLPNSGSNCVGSDTMKNGGVDLVLLSYETTDSSVVKIDYTCGGRYVLSPYRYKHNRTSTWNFNETNASPVPGIANNSMKSSSDCIVEISDSHSNSGNTDSSGTGSEENIIPVHMHNMVADPQRKQLFTSSSDMYGSHSSGVTTQSSLKSNELSTKPSKRGNRKNIASKVTLGIETLQENSNAKMRSVKQLVSVFQCHTTKEFHAKLAFQNINTLSESSKSPDFQGFYSSSDSCKLRYGDSSDAHLSSAMEETSNSGPNSDGSLVVASDGSDEGTVSQRSHNNVDNFLKMQLPSYNIHGEVQQLNRCKRESFDCLNNNSSNARDELVNGELPEDSGEAEVKSEEIYATSSQCIVFENTQNTPVTVASEERSKSIHKDTKIQDLTSFHNMTLLQSSVKSDTPVSSSNSGVKVEPNIPVSSEIPDIKSEKSAVSPQEHKNLSLSLRAMEQHGSNNCSSLSDTTLGSSPSVDEFDKKPSECFDVGSNALNDDFGYDKLSTDISDAEMKYEEDGSSQCHMTDKTNTSTSLDKNPTILKCDTRNLKSSYIEIPVRPSCESKLGLLNETKILPVTEDANSSIPGSSNVTVKLKDSPDTKSRKWFMAQKDHRMASPCTRKLFTSANDKFDSSIETPATLNNPTDKSLYGVTSESLDRVNSNCALKLKSEEMWENCNIDEQSKDKHIKDGEIATDNDSHLVPLEPEECSKTLKDISPKKHGRNHNKDRGNSKVIGTSEENGKTPIIGCGNIIQVCENTNNYPISSAGTSLQCENTRLYRNSFDSDNKMLVQKIDTNLSSHISLHGRSVSNCDSDESKPCETSDVYQKPSKCFDVDKNTVKYDLGYGKSPADISDAGMRSEEDDISSQCHMPDKINPSASVDTKPTILKSDTGSLKGSFIKIPISPPCESKLGILNESKILSVTRDTDSLISISNNGIVKLKDSPDTISRKCSVKQEHTMASPCKRQLFTAQNVKSDISIKTPETLSKKTVKSLYGVTSESLDCVNSNGALKLKSEEMQENHNTVEQLKDTHVEDGEVSNESTSHIVRSVPEECSKTVTGMSPKKHGLNHNEDSPKLIGASEDMGETGIISSDNVIQVCDNANNYAIGSACVNKAIPSLQLENTRRHSARLYNKLFGNNENVLVQNEDGDMPSTSLHSSSVTNHDSYEKKIHLLSGAKQKLMKRVQMIIHNTSGAPVSKRRRLVIDTSCKNECASSKEELVNFDEDLISEIRQLLDAHASKLQKVDHRSINITWKCPLAHTISTALTAVSTKLGKHVKISKEAFSGEEEEVIMSNWKKFCEEYDVSNPSPFVDLHRSSLDNEQRTKFVQCIGRTLDNRTLHQIYRRFQYLMSKHADMLENTPTAQKLDFKSSEKSEILHSNI